MGEDPAAEFLQAEGDELRELGIDDQGFVDSGFTLVNNEAPPADLPVDPFEDPFSAPPQDPFSAPSDVVPPADEEVEAVAPAEPVLMNDADFVNEFEADPVALPDFPVDPLENGFSEPVGVVENSAPPQTIHQIVPNEEPESLLKWRTDKAELLQQQEVEEEEAVQAWSEKAKKETEDWYNRYNEQQEKVRNENRAAETQFIEEMTDTKPGNEWEKVARFCDFNPKLSKNSKDVSRMRSLLLQLKQTPLVR